MDELGGFLDGPRARGAFLLRVVMEPPWSVRVQDEAPLALVAVIRGGGVLRRGDEEVRLGPGDVAVVRGPEPYTMADRAGTPPQVVIHPGQRCATPEGVDLADAMHLGVRTWGNHPAGSTVLLIGTYEQHGEIGQRLLSALPPHLVLAADDWRSPLVPLLADEVARDEPGQETVLDRLLDLVLIAVLRTWFSRPDAAAPSWYRAHGDPVVGRALRLLMAQPAHPWTVGSLAAEVGASRAALARRFTDLVGEPPMGFLTAWRLALAADLLREPGTTVAAVAGQVGYGTPFALSAAFKRVRGVSPRDHREAALAGGRRP